MVPAVRRARRRQFWDRCARSDPAPGSRRGCRSPCRWAHYEVADRDGPSTHLVAGTDCLRRYYLADGKLVGAALIAVQIHRRALVVLDLYAIDADTAEAGNDAYDTGTADTASANSGTADAAPLGRDSSTADTACTVARAADAAGNGAADIGNPVPPMPPAP